MNKDLKTILNTFQTKKTLCPKIFKNEKLNTGIKKTIEKIVDEFVDFVNIDFFIHDIVLTGSLANYNWSNYSDFDLHIMIDMDELSKDKVIRHLISEFFNSKKGEWNNKHDITIKGFDLEIYVQDINEEHISTGVFSIMNQEWIVKPKKIDDKFDRKMVEKKVKNYMDKIDEIEEKFRKGSDIHKQVDKLYNKIKKFRKSGLSKNGEMSYENLTFKVLRRNKSIEKLLNLKNRNIDRNLSLKEIHFLY